MNLSLSEVALAGAVQSLVLAVCALILVWLMLRVLDKLAGRPFGEIYEVITLDAKASALYFGLRFAGACTLVGMVI